MIMRAIWLTQPNLWFTVKKKPHICSVIENKTLNCIELKTVDEICLFMQLSKFLHTTLLGRMVALGMAG